MDVKACVQLCMCAQSVSYRASVAMATPVTSCAYTHPSPHKTTHLTTHTSPHTHINTHAGALKDSLDQVLSSWEFDQVSMAHGHFISSGGKQAFTEGTAAFVNDIVRSKQTAAAAAGGSSLAGTGTAVLVAAAVISTAVGIGVAGILQARAGQ